MEKAVQNDLLKDNEAVKKMVSALIDTKGACHVMGLVSPGGVHSFEGHISAMCNTLVQLGAFRYRCHLDAALLTVDSHIYLGVPVFLHCFTDGRDTPPMDAASSLPAFFSTLDSTQEFSDDACQLIF